MSLADTLSQDMKASMKAKDSATLSTLRLLLSALKNKKIDVQHELSDAEVQDVIKMQVKQLKDAIVSFEQGSRAEMVESAKKEISVLEKFLPAKMSDEELKALVAQVIAETGVTSKADMGRVMGAAVKASQGRADGSRVKEIVMHLLPVVALIVVGSSVALKSVLAAIPLVGENVGIDVSFIELGLRIFRVLILWLGIPAITLILTGGFHYMNASNNDDVHKKAWGLITRGIIVSIAVILTFSFSTLLLQHL